MNLIVERQTIHIPRGHQIEGCKFVVSHSKYFALFMEQGTGKSKTTLMILKEFNRLYGVDRLLVICPNSLKYQWAGEILKDDCELEFESMYFDGFKSNKKRYKFKDLLESKKLKVFVMNYEAIRSKANHMFIKMFCSEGIPMIICDESTNIKNLNALQTKNIIRGFAKRSFKGILTGTATPNKPIDLYSQFEFLKSGFWGMSFFTFRRMYQIMLKRYNPNTGRYFTDTIDLKTWESLKFDLFELESSGVTKMEEFEELADKYNMQLKDVLLVRSQDAYTPYKNLDKLWGKIAHCTFTKTKEECLDLPPKIYEKLEVELTKEQKKAIDELKRNFFTEYNMELLTAEVVIVVQNRIQMILAGVFPYQKFDTNHKGLIDKKTKYIRMSKSPKIDALLQSIQEIPNTTSIIVWSVIVEELKWAYEKLKEKGYSVALYIGETPHEERKKIEEDFKTKNIQILVINTMLGEVGLNFQVASIAYYLTNDYKEDRRLQSEDRMHRMGQTKPVTYIDIIARGSLDTKILEAQARKKDLIEYFKKKPEELFKD